MVIALDKNKRPLGFITERRARILMTKRRACVYRSFPFIVIIKEIDARTIDTLPTYTVKLDPGSVYDGIAIVNDETGDFVWGMQIEHRGHQVRNGLDTRRSARRNRRSRETLYRRSKFKNGGDRPTPRKNGQLPPSVASIIGNTETWLRRLRRWVRITDAAMEDVRIDTQKMDDPDIDGREYQHGTLTGYEIRTFLMEKYQHTCQYCGGMSGDPVLEWEHKIPRSRGGSDSVRNATLACHSCNQAKGVMKPDEWIGFIRMKAHKTKLDTARIDGITHVIDNKITGKSNRYAAWVNATRKVLESFLVGMFGRERCDFASGGRTKYNRTKAGLPKDHQYDAYCVGHDFKAGKDLTHGYFLYAKATGRGTHFRGKINACGIIIKKLPPRAKRIFGFINGDIVKAIVPHKEKHPYKYEGTFVGRIMTRASGSFDIRITKGELVTVSHKFCQMLQMADGYQYTIDRTRDAIPLGTEVPRILAEIS